MPDVQDASFVYAGRLWLLLASVTAALFCAELEIGMLPIAIPNIASDLGMQGSEWIGSAALIAAAAVLPWSGRLADGFGRRNALAAFLLLSIVGSVLAALAPSGPVIITARVIQGMAFGAIRNLVYIIVTDTFALARRAIALAVLYAGTLLGASLGPPIAGGLGQAHWRWLFWIAVVITASSATSVCWTGRHLNRPTLTARETLIGLDWVGNGLAILALTLVCLALSWAGAQYSWSSAATLVPLLTGLVVLVVFVWYETQLEHPTIPFRTFTSRTVILGNLSAALHHVVHQAAAFSIVVYFEACLLQSPLKAAASSLAFMATSQASALLVGIWIQRTQRYRLETIGSYALLVIGCALAARMDASGSPGAWASALVVAGIGSGALYQLEDYPSLAALPPELQGEGMSFLNLCATLGQVLGLSLAVNILQTSLGGSLPSAYLDQLGSRSSLLYTAIAPARHLRALAGARSPTSLTKLHSDDAALRQAVQDAFGGAHRRLFIVLAVLSSLGCLMACGLRAMDLHQRTDARWDMSPTKSQSHSAASEKAAA